MGMNQQAIRAILEADTSGFKAAMGEAANVSEKELKRIQSLMKPLAEAIRAQEKAQRDLAAEAARSGKTQADAMEHVGLHTAGAKRELLVLLHEASQGNWKNFGGSLMVIGERANLMELAFTRTGLAVGGAVAIVASAIAIFAKGAIQAEHFAKALQLTGNYAAVSEASIKAMAQTQAMQTGQTFGQARESVTTAAGSGLFGVSSVQAAARAMGDYERVTGATAEEALKHFEAIRQGALKWATQENETVHFLTATDYEHIKALEETGKAEEAVRVALGAWANTVEQRSVPQLGYLERAWKAVKDAASAAGEAMLAAGRPKTLEDQIALLESHKAAITSGPFATSEKTVTGQYRLAGVQDQIDSLKEQQHLLAIARGHTAEAEAMSQASIKAHEYVASVHDRVKATDTLAAALEKYRANAALAGTSPAQMKEDEAQIRKDHTPAPTAGANAYSGMVETIRAYNEVSRAEISNQSKLSEAQQWSVEMHKRLDEAAKNLTTAQRAAISTLIDNAAAEREVADAEVQGRKARIAAIVAETASDEAQYRKSGEFLLRGEARVAQVIRETQMIGLNADERRRAQALQEIDLELLAQNAGATAAVREENERYAQQQREHMIPALEAAKKAQDAWNASFGNGARAALDEFAKAAQNTASLAQHFIGDSMQTIEDTMVQAAMTGKLTFAKMVDAIIADYIRLQVIKPLLGKGAGFVSDLYGLYSGSGWGTGETHANGLDYVPYTGFTAVLGEGERIVSRQDNVNGNRGGSTHFDFSGQTINVGAGVNMQQVNAAVAHGNAEQERRFRRLAQQGRF